MSSYTFTTHVGDGTTKVFPFSFAGQDYGYLRTTDITVYVAGVSNLFSINPTDPNRVILTTAPPVGAEVLIRRIMPKEVPYADFARGNPFSQDTLNNTNLQMLYNIQEIFDGYLPDGFYFRQDVNMFGHIFYNLGEGTKSGDSINFDQFDEQVKKIEAIEDVVLNGDMTIRNVAFRFTSTQSMVSWTPGITFTNAYLYINGVWQNKLDGAFSINNNTIYFAEALPAGLLLYALLGTGPVLPDDYKTEEELQALYFNGIYQRLDTLDGDVADLGDETVALGLRITANGQAITTLANRVTNLETRMTTEEGKIQSVALGGTGNTAGRAATATKLDVPRGVRTNLASTSAVNFDGSADINPGVTGVLPVTNGGTGSSTASGGLTNLGGLPLVGVQAAPTTGQVGEILEVTGVDTTVSTGTFTTVATLQLTAGVWEVSGNIIITGSTSNIVAYNCGIAQVTGAGAGYPRSLAYNGPAITQQGMAIPVQRIVVTQPTNVYAIAWLNFSTGTATARGFIHAHRAR